MTVWRYKLEHTEWYVSKHLEGLSFWSPWGSIKDGTITIPRDYCWDGCSPKVKIPGGKFLPRGIYLGIWDGQLGTNGRPQAWRASLVHDLLCQYKHDIKGLTKEKTTGIFNDILKEDGFPDWLRWLYVKAVWCFGPQKFGDRV